MTVDLSYSYQALGGVGSTSQSSRVQDGGKSRHAERRANNVFSAGSSAYEEANIQADKAISGKDVPTKWHERTNRAVFTWQQPRRKGGTVSYEDRKSTWNSGVRKAIRRGSAEEEVRKHRDCVTGAWKQISKQRRRVDVSYDPSMVTALQHGTWMDEEVSKRLVSGRRKKGRHPPAFLRVHG